MNFPALFAVGPLGTTEILIILFIILLLFGAKKLPELARGLGKAKNEFTKAASEIEQEVNAPVDPKAPAKEAPPPSSPAGRN